MITHFKLSDGRETTEKREIVSQVLSFYEDLYSAETCDSEAMDFFLSGIPKLSGDKKIQLENVPGYVCNPGSPRERDAASRRYGEHHQCCPALNHMCNQSKLTARRQVR